jgi:hypothetical protein
MGHETIIYKRDELYGLVWSKPVRHVAKTYSVSGVALAKICRRLNVPVPGRGHWARVAAGQKPKRRPLAPLRAGEPAEVRSRRWRMPTPPEYTATEMTERAAGKSREEEVPIRVGTSLHQPHELVALTLAALRKAKSADDGIARCRDRRCLAVEVAPARVDRALHIMDALLKALAARGLDVEVLNPKEFAVWFPGVTLRQVKMPVTLVRVDGESVPFALEEITENVQVDRGDPTRWRQPTFERRATGKLRLRIRDDLDAYRFRVGVQKNWADTEKRRVEGCLNAFVRGLHTIASAIKRERVESEQRRKEQEESRRRWQLERDRQQLDERCRKRVEEEVPRWRLAREIREYVLETRRIIEEGQCTVIPDGELDEWLRWCDAYAMRVDPLESLRQEIVRVKATRPTDGKPCAGQGSCAPSEDSPANGTEAAAGSGSAEP